MSEAESPLIKTKNALLSLAVILPLGRKMGKMAFSVCRFTMGIYVIVKLKLK